MEMLYGWVRNAYEPLLYRGAFMDMVRGREMSRPGAGDRGTGHSIMQQLFRLSQLSTPTEKAYLQSLVLSLIHIWHMARHCTGCQLCVAVCPNGVLRPSSALATLMQPEMSYERGYCRPECTKCCLLYTSRRQQT